MQSQPSLKRGVLAGQILVALICIGVVGASWLFSKYLAFCRDIGELKTTLRTQQEQLLKHEVEKVVDFINYQKTQTRQRLATDIKGRVEEAHAIAAGLYRQNQGRLPEAAIAALIKEALRPIRFNKGRGYYFILGMDGVNVLLADRPEMEGQDLLPIQGSRGEFVARDLIALVKDKTEGFYEYTWTKPGNPDRVHPKIAYVKHFAPFAWLIGTGEYLDDVESDIQNETLARIAQIQFANGGYIFAGTWDGVSLAGPAKGQNMIGITDANGVAIVTELIRLAKGGGGYLEYLMPAIDGHAPAPKISYAVGIDAWQWYVGAGAYLDDIETLAAKRRAAMEESIAVSGLYIGLVLMVALLIAYLVSNRIAGRIQSNCDVLTRFCDQAATRLAPVDNQALAFAEFQALAEAFNRMLAGRKRVEQERTRFFTLSIDMLCVAGFDGYFKEINPAWHKTLGWASDEILSRPWLDLVHPEDHQQTIAAGQRLAAGQAVYQFENRYRCKDGTYRWMAWNSFPLPEERLIFGVVRDVTEQKRDEAARKLDESRLEALLRLNQMVEAPLQDIASRTMEEAVRLTGSTIGYIAFLNSEQTVLTMHAWSQAAMEQCRVANKPIDYPVASTGLWGEAVRQGRPIITNDYQAPNPLKRGLPEGHVTIRRHLNVPISDGQRIVLVAGVGNKATDYDEADVRQLRLLMSGMLAVIQRQSAEQERHKLEGQLRQAQKMEAIGTLAGGIAHDFNNLLQAIQGHVELLLMDKPSDHPDFRGLSQIGLAVRRASDLTRQVLTFSRKVDARLAPIGLNTLIEGLKSMLDHTIARMITIELDLVPALWNIRADKAQVEQVIMNLVVNAKDAMPEGGKIRIATENITIGPHDAHSDLDILPGRYVQLCVSDTGHGMEEKILQNIYDPFFTTKEPGRGTGLGLAMVYGIVKAHGGRIACHSQPGQGTRFTICLPAMDADGAADESYSAEQPVGGNETILLVDDEEFIRDLGQRILTRFGYRVLTVSTGEQALDLVRSGQSFDLVILDLIMPGMGGRQCLARLLAERPGLRVIVASGYSFDSPVADILTLGAKGFMHKPFQMAEMLRQIRGVLDGGAYSG